VYKITKTIREDENERLLVKPGTPEQRNNGTPEHGTPEQHHSGTRNTGTLKILNLLKIRKKITGGCVKLLLEKLLRKTCFLIIF
jgi:hypothetical protein